jgi:hypothetical protein
LYLSATADSIFELLGSPGIDSKKSILPSYVAWRAYSTTLFLLGSWPPEIVLKFQQRLHRLAESIPGLLKRLQILALTELYHMQDFALGLSILVKGSEEEKLRWTFNMYDLNGDGVITRDEMEDVVASVRQSLSIDSY